MQIGSYRFAPPWWGVLITVVGVAIFCALTAWQIERAHYKEGLVAVHEAAEATGPQPMRLSAAAVRAGSGPRYGFRYIASGHYDPKHQLLLANQVESTRTGYQVWTPLVLDSGVRIMVDRGWVPQGDERNAPEPNPDAPTGSVTIRGYWRDFPQPGLRFDKSTHCDQSGWPRALNFPTVATVRCQYRAPVANGLLLLDPKAPGGFVRDQTEDDAIGLRPWGHYIYASQWFLMGVVAVIILVVVNTKRRD